MGRLARAHLATALAGCALASACFLDDLLSPKAPQTLTVEVLTDSLMVVGDTVRLSVRALADGQPYAGVRFGYAATRGAVATVDDSGRVAVLQRDTFGIQVTIRSGSLAGQAPSATGRFRGGVARVVADADSVRFGSLGATRQLSAAGQKKQGQSITGVRFTWTSDSAQVARVDSTGSMTAVRNGGPARIIVTADNRADTIPVRVRQRTKTLTLSPGNATLFGVGEAVQFSADARDSLGVANTASLISWSATAVAVLTVSQTGLATATGEGIAGVVATSDGVADTSRVIVSRLLQQLIVTPAQATVAALGDQVSLAARGVVQPGDTVAVPAIQWRSLDASIATVDTAGVVTATGSGTARIVGNAGGQEDTALVTVDQVLASVAIVRPASDTTLTSLQDSARVVAQGRDRNGNAIPPDRCCLFAFASANSAVATVDQTGLVVAQNNGSATITATAGGFGGSRVVNVSQQVWSVLVTPRRVALVNGQFFLLQASASDRRGFSMGGTSFSWTSRNVGLANPGSGTTDTARVRGGDGQNDSTYVLASAGGHSDSSLVRVGPLTALCTGGTPHTGNISASQTWTRVASPHCVGGEVLIQAATLTIEAGATVKFAAGAEIRLGACCNPGQSGRLRAVGTPTLPITFTALDANPPAGQWGGIRTNWVAPNDSLIIRNAVLEYGGGGAGLQNYQPNLATISNVNTCQGTIVLDAVTIRQSRFEGVSTPCALTVTNSLITGAHSTAVLSTGGPTRITQTRIVDNTDGLSISGTATLLDLRGSRITANPGQWPLSVRASALDAIQDVPADSLIGNGRDVIRVIDNGNLVTRDLFIDRRLPWRIQGFVTIGGGRTLTVDPGTTIVMEGSGSGLWIGGGPAGGQGQGRLLAQGTAANPIRFVAADTTNRWHVLAIISQSDTSKLRHTIIEYGGNSGWPAALTIDDGAGRPVRLDTVTVRRSAGDGIFAANVIVQGPIYADSNGGRGMALNGRDVTLVDSRFVGNGSHGLETGSTAQKLTVRRSQFLRNGGTGARLNADSSTADSSLIRRNGGDGITFCCASNNPLRPALLRSVVDSNAQAGVSTAGAVEGRVQDNQIIGNGGVGLTHHNGGVVSGNRIRGNRLPVVVTGSALSALTGQSIDSLLGNTGDTLVVDCCGDQEVTSSDTIRTRPQLPWRIDVGLRFINRTVWKLEPGSSVFLNGGRIQMGQNPSCNPSTQGAVLLAQSDDTGPIRFTSNSQSRGAWAQILFECLSDTTKLRNVEVSYAGGFVAGDAIRIAPGTAGVPVILDSVRVRQSFSRGILIQNGARVIVQRYLAADSNNAEGLYVEPSGVSVPAGSFSYNGGRGIAVYGTKFSLTSAQVRSNGGRGVEINADSATLTGAAVLRNASGVVIQGSKDHVITGSTLDSNGGGLEVFGGPLRFTNNFVRYNTSDGVGGVSGSQFYSTFSGNTITGNGRYGVVLDGASLGPFASQNQSTLLGNARDTLCICSGPSQAYFTTGSPTVRAALPWKNQVGITVGGDQTLTLDPGSRIVMDAGGALYVGRGDGSYRGRLLALGTVANPIRIAGRDTTVRGFWNHLAIENQNDSSILRYVEIVGGGGGLSLQQLYVGDLAGKVIRLDTVTVRKSARHGVWFGGGPFRVNGLRAIDNDSAGAVLTGGTVTINNSRFENNGVWGIRADAGGHIISNSILASNGTWGLFNATVNVVNAMMNWWGHASGPSGQGTGSGNAVSVNVDFSNWLSSPPTIP